MRAAFADAALGVIVAISSTCRLQKKQRRFLLHYADIAKV